MASWPKRHFYADRLALGLWESIYQCRGRIKNKSHSALNRSTNQIGIKLCAKLLVGVWLFWKIKSKTNWMQINKFPSLHNKIGNQNDIINIWNQGFLMELEEWEKQTYSSKSNQFLIDNCLYNSVAILMSNPQNESHPFQHQHHFPFPNPIPKAQMEFHLP